MPRPAKHPSHRPILDRPSTNYRFARWLIFGVLFALVPLFFSWVAREMRSQPNGLDVVLANGELFLVTAGICGAAVGELVAVVRTSRQPFWEIVARGCCLIVVVLSAHLLPTSPPCGPAQPPSTRDG